MVDFEPLGALLGPRAPDPDLLRFVLKLSAQDNTKSLQIPSYVFDLNLSLASSEPLKLLSFNVLGST